jgi:hypothetical protein
MAAIGRTAARRPPRTRIVYARRGLENINPETRRGGIILPEALPPAADSD